MRRLVCICLVLLAACGSGSRHNESPEIRVAAAASLTGAIGDLAAAYPDARVVCNYGASSDLARQIKDGAPADVYISASSKWADYMVSEGLTGIPPLTIARNVLVCVVPADSRADVKDLNALPQAGFRRIVIGDEGVPAGDYTRQAFKAANVQEELKSSLIGQKDVRTVVKAVESGEADCGFVYATDARTAKVRVLFTVDAALHAEIGYYACLLKSAANPEQARAFITFLTSPEATAILRKAGFVVFDAD
ncbi:MAG: molybdate ABC transporter substrate-binding protein [Planctomycetes bacterium]|nr:molybdate ABC transporter substrate-binding protein [Planctomycetota bacterium]